MAKKIKEVDVRDTIMSDLKERWLGIPWLSKTTGIPYHTLYSIFIKKDRTLTDEKRETINRWLNSNY